MKTIMTNTETTTELTPKVIFEKNQILTLEIAKKLIDNKIAITSPEYRMNTPHVSIFTVNNIISKWDWAKTEAFPTEEFENRQEYWASYMTKIQIENNKQTLLLMDERNKWQCSCIADRKLSWFPEPTFHGSDEDREVYFINLSEIDNND